MIKKVKLKLFEKKTNKDFAVLEFKAVLLLDLLMTYSNLYIVL